MNNDGIHSIINNTIKVWLIDNNISLK
jgi:hypothetical protein